MWKLMVLFLALVKSECLARQGSFTMYGEQGSTVQYVLLTYHIRSIEVRCNANRFSRRKTTFFKSAERHISLAQVYEYMMRFDCERSVSSLKLVSPMELSNMNESQCTG
jgi:hypothetical protein